MKLNVILLFLTIFIGVNCTNNTKKSSKKQTYPKSISQLKSMYKQGKYRDLLDILALNKKRLKNEAEFWNIYGLTLRINAYLDKDEELRKNEVQAFQKSIKLKPAWGVPYFNLANTYWEMKSHLKACEIYKDVLTKNPNYPDKKIILKRLEQCLKKENTSTSPNKHSDSNKKKSNKTSNLQIKKLSNNKKPNLQTNKNSELNKNNADLKNKKKKISK